MRQKGLSFDKYYYYSCSVLDACTYDNLDFLFGFLLEAMLVESPTSLAAVISGLS